MNEIMDFITEKQREEIGEAVKNKMLEVVSSVDVKSMQEEIKALVLEDLKVCLDANYMSDAVEWGEIGGVLAKVMLNTIKKAFKEEAC